MQKKKLLIGIIVVILLIVTINIFQIPRRIYEKNMYSIKYYDEVIKYSNEFDADPFLVFAIIKAESNFTPDVVSSSGAIGLMQLMETTASEVAGKLGIENYTTEDLYNPDINIKIGIKYYTYLLNEFKNNEYLAITAYNAGLGKVNQWINEGVIKADGSDIENIPYRETNIYVRKILRDYEIYKELYK